MLLSTFLLQHPAAGWLALLGLLVPLAIHLWNRRPGRLVQVGSLRWLSTAANRRMRNLKLEQLLLLLLRATIVAVLALALADPIRQMPAPPRRGQVLLSPALLHSASLVAIRSTVDSLRKQGYELRQLGPGLPRLSAAQWRRFDSVAAATNAPSSSEPSSDNLWARVQQAADSLPERPLQVFTLATQRNFRGTQPALPNTVRWQTVPSTDSSTWLQAAYKSPAADSLYLLLGSSNEAATSFRTVALSSAAGALPHIPGLVSLRYEPASGGQAFVRTSNNQGVPVQTMPLRIAVYHDAAHAQDAKYLRAALRAASLGLPLAPTIAVSTTPPAADASLKWLFWLSDAPVPAAWQHRISQGLRLWQEAPAPGVATETTLAMSSPEPVRLLRRDTSAPRKDAVVLWADGLGQPVLTYSAQAQGSIYQLHTRLHPGWSELGSSPELPALLLPLLQPETLTPGMAQHDLRGLDATQIFARTQTRSTSPTHVTTALRPTHTDLRPWIIVAAALLFGLERWLARYRSISSPSATV